MYKNGKLKKRTIQNVSELSQVDVLIYKIRQQSDLHHRCRRHNGQNSVQEKKKRLTVVLCVQKWWNYFGKFTKAKIIVSVFQFVCFGFHRLRRWFQVFLFSTLDRFCENKFSTENEQSLSRVTKVIPISFSSLILSYILYILLFCIKTWCIWLDASYSFSESACCCCCYFATFTLTSSFVATASKNHFTTMPDYYLLLFGFAASSVFRVLPLLLVECHSMNAVLALCAGIKFEKIT